MKLLNSLVAWVRARPTKVLVLFLAFETLIFLSLLVLLVWVLLN
jgi:hypothetical protein